MMAGRLLVAAALVLASGQGFALELDAVLQRAMVAPPARVEFREERHNKMFEESLWLSGYLEYLEDGALRKVVVDPFEESFHVYLDRIEIERGGETEVLPAGKSRSLKAMLGGIEAILAGHTGRLEKVFRYEVVGTEADWSLQLTPKSRRVARQLKGLVVTGNDESVTSIRVELRGGEWHHMEILRDSTDPGTRQTNE